MAPVTVRKYFVVTVRGERGPLEKSDIKQLLRDGEIQRSDQVRTATGRGLGTVAEFLADDRARATADLGAMRLDLPPPAPVARDEETVPNGGGPVPRRRISGRQPDRRSAGPPWPWIVAGVVAVAVVIGGVLMVGGGSTPEPAPATNAPSSTASTTTTVRDPSPPSVDNRSATEPSLQLEPIASEPSGKPVPNATTGPTTAPAPGTSNVDPTTWATADVGGGILLGSGPVATKAGVWTMTAAGADIWNNKDQFRFAATGERGDVTITTCVMDFKGSQRFDKAGLMFRVDSDPGAAFLMIDVCHGGQFQSEMRRDNHGTTAVALNEDKPRRFPLWVRLTRRNGECTTQFSTNGKDWQTHDVFTAPALAGPILAGLIVCSHEDGTSSTAEFSQITITSP